MINKNDLLSFTFNEYFNINNAKKLINNWDKVIEQLPLERQKKINEKAKEFDPLNAVKKIAKNKNGINHVKYSFSKSSKYHGRLFAKSASLQGLPREFRALLANDYYIDIDFVSCHPNILEQYCKKKGIKCDVLAKYNSNRDIIIQEIANDLKLDKRDVKDLFLKLINGGKLEGIINDFITSFKNEMKTMHNIIVELNPIILKQVKRVCGDKEENLNGKVINRILCDIENNIMLTAVEFLMNEGYNVDCLIHDGFLVRKEENKKIDLNILQKTSAYVYEKTEYNLKLVHKEFDNIIDLSKFKDEEDFNELKDQETYYKDKQEFEKNHFKIMCPPSYVTLQENGELYIQSTEHFKQSYSHKMTKKIIYISGKPTLQTDAFTYHWMKDPTIRLYDKADFYPNKSKCPSNVYNLFNGFKADEYEPINNIEIINKLVEPIIHQLKVIAQDDYEFLIIYYAFIVQYPEFKTNINIVIAGKDGSGKSIINDFYREKILSSDISAQTDDTDEIFGKFSNIYVKKIFLQIDEICKEDFQKKKLEKLKNITTSRTLKYEKKGFDPITINNYLNTIMTTNNDFTIPISQTDRRNVFFKCDDRYIGDYNYWNTLSRHLSKNDVARAFYEYLLNYDLLKIFGENNIENGLQMIRPNTKYTEEIKNLCLSYNYRFLSGLTSYIYVEQKYLDDDDDKNINDINLITIRANDLYSLYIKWFEKCKWSSKPSSVTKFFIDIKNIKGINKIRKTISIYYKINKKELYEYLISNKLFDEDIFIDF